MRDNAGLCFDLNTLLESGCAGSPRRTGLWLFSLFCREETGNFAKLAFLRRPQCHFIAQISYGLRRIPYRAEQGKSTKLQGVHSLKQDQCRKRPVLARLFGRL